MRLSLYPTVLWVVAACASGGQPIDAGSSTVDGRVLDGPAADAGDPDAGNADAAVADAAVADAAMADARVVDARPVDATPLDAMVDAQMIDGPPPVVASLLLTEIVLAPTGGEFVEIVNPTAAAVDLSTYYLTDAPQYFRLPEGVAAVAADASDFVARFPAGAMIPAGGVVTVAIDTAANFTIAYPGVTADYSLASGTMTVLTAGTATLTNAGEPVVLFNWNGASDLVTDVDIMLAGTPSAANLLASKSGVAIDGPDANTTTATYATDANTVPTQTAPGSARSTKRIALESAAVEVQTGGGNGVAGHDETSEQTNLTWDTGSYTAPTPGQVPPALVP